MAVRKALLAISCLLASSLLFGCVETFQQIDEIVSDPSSRKVAKPTYGELPRIYIDTRYGDTDEITKEYKNFGLKVVDADNGDFPALLDMDARIRVRGNYTAIAPKLPYTFKLSRKSDLLGLGENKKWGLLAEYYDKSMMRNKMVHDFSKKLNVPTQLDSRYVDVFMNDRYIGCYLLTELPTDNTTGIDTKSGDFLLERTTRAKKDDEVYLTSPIYGYTFELKDPSSPSDVQMEVALSMLEAVETAIESNDESLASKLIDFDSFASIYILEELFKDPDFIEDSDYFYFKDGKLYAGPIWDMDSSTGNSKEHDYNSLYFNSIDKHGNVMGDGSGDSTHGIWAAREWFGKLLSFDSFSQMVYEKLKSVEGDYENLYKDNGAIDQLVEENLIAFERNYSEAGWNLIDDYEYGYIASFETYDEYVDDLKQWLKSRKEWLYANIDSYRRA